MRLNIIVPAAYQQLAQSLCAAVAEGNAGEGMFTTGVGAADTATHYISSGYIEDGLAALLPLTTFSEVEGERAESTRPGNVAVVEQMAAQAGFELPPGTIGALFNAIDVTDYYAVGPFERLAQLGLSVITETQDESA